MSTLSLAALAVRKEDYQKIESKVAQANPDINMVIDNKFVVLSWRWRKLYMNNGFNDLIKTVDCKNIPFSYIEYDEYGNLETKESTYECEDLEEFFSLEMNIKINHYDLNVV